MNYLYSVSGVLMNAAVGEQPVYDRESNQKTGDVKKVIVLNIIGMELVKGTLVGAIANLYVHDLSLLDEYQKLRGKKIHVPIRSAVIGHDKVVHFIASGYSPAGQYQEFDVDASLDIAFNAVDEAA